jgi:hypothetical protein
MPWLSLHPGHSNIAKLSLAMLTFAIYQPHGVLLVVLVAGVISGTKT